MDCCRAADEGVSTCPVNRQRGADRETNEREAEPQNQHTYRRGCSNLAIARLFLMHLSAAGYGASASFTTPAADNDAPFQLTILPKHHLILMQGLTLHHVAHTVRASRSRLTLRDCRGTLGPKCRQKRVER